MAELKSLGQRIRIRRQELGFTREAVAKAAEISIQQLAIYEKALGHAPACTLQRIARALDTSTSVLLGEPVNEYATQVEELLLQVYRHPDVNDVVLSMRAMDRADLRSMKIIAKAFAARQRNVSDVDKARSNQIDAVR
jgi:transcriptional regulator with XRE-family HTH domain